MSHSHHIWITRTVTCPFQTPLLTLLYFGNVYFLSDIKSGKIFFSLSWIRIASLSGTLSKFCFPSQEKLLIENQVAGKKKATSNNTCWVTFPTPAVFHLFLFCRYLPDFAIVRHFSTFPSCRHEVVDQRSNFSWDSSIKFLNPRPNGRLRWCCGRPIAHLWPNPHISWFKCEEMRIWYYDSLRFCPSFFGQWSANCTWMVASIRWLKYICGEMKIRRRRKG